MVFLDPLPSIVNKIKASARITALLPASHVHAGFMPSIPDVKGIYVTPLSGNLSQIVSSANQTNQILTGNLRFQIDSLSGEGMEDAVLLAKTACEVCLPSIKTAGIFSLSFQPRTVSYDKGYGSYRATYRLEAPCVEHVTG
jgi:hypothetical protein